MPSKPTSESQPELSIRDIQPVPTVQQRYPRIPIRWRWAALVGFAVTAAVVVLYSIILDIERHAWLDNQAAQAELQVDRLSDELKLPLLSGSSSETDIIVQRFLEKVPTVMVVLIRYADGTDQWYGAADRKVAATTTLQHLVTGNQVKRLPLQALWYGKSVMYDQTQLAVIAAQFSEQAWDQLAGKLARNILIAAVLVVLFSALLVFWVAGRMSSPIEMLADAAAKVADGDYQVQLPVRGNDELSDALTQFNAMVRGLAHKEELRGVFARYLNPKLVSDVFENADVEMQSHRQDISVLFADMVQFTAFSEGRDTAEVVLMLNQYFEVFHRIITHYGGHVDKYMGDAVMAVFNHPVADVHHLRHAVTAGLALNLACRKLAAPGGETNTDTGAEFIRFRIGLNCGQAIVGNIGAAERLEYTVIGDVVNIASRLGGLGDGDELIISRQSFDRLAEGFNFYSIGRRDIKGISQPMEVGTVRVTSLEARQQIEQVVDAALLSAFPPDLDTPDGET